MMWMLTGCFLVHGNGGSSGNEDALTWFDECRGTPIPPDGPDGATALGATPRELVQAHTTSSFTVAWAEPANPVPTAWTMVLDPDTASANSVAWEPAEGCPTGPEVVLLVNGTLTSGDVVLEAASVGLAWQPPEYIGGEMRGEPGFSATYVRDEAIEAWVRAAIEADFPGEGDSPLLYVSLWGHLGHGMAGLSASLIVDGESRSYDLPEFDGTLTVVE